MLVWLWSACGGELPPSPPRQAELGLPIQAFRIANNGLRVVLIPDPKASQIQVTMRYRVGQIDEPAGQEGIAHLAEHLLFIPVIGKDRETLHARLEATAPWFNALTELEFTTYIARGDPSRLTELLNIEALRLTARCRTLTEAEFVRERDVVRNELRQRADAFRTRNVLLAALYAERHAYRRATIADEASVGRISREQACAFIDAHYSPDNAVLIVSGNVTPKALDDALHEMLGRVPKRQLAAHPAVTPLVPGPPVTREVPIDQPVAIVAWPLAVEPEQRARTRVVATMMALHAGAEIEGTIRVIELGGPGAPAIAFRIEPGRGQSVGEAVEATRRVVQSGHVWLYPSAFHGARSRAGYHLFAQFEDGTETARLVSDHVVAGRHPLDGLEAEIRALNQLSADTAREIMQQRLAFSQATIVTLLPEPERIRPRVPQAVAAEAPADLDAGIHRAGEPRVRADPAAAHAEAKRTTDRDPLAGIRERTLANGLRVILMPLASVPTVDARLVFPAGAIDELALQRGVSYAAAHALRPSPEDRDVMRVALRAGTLYAAWVGAEHTTFSARGLAMHVDMLLHGLDRLVRNGTYDDRDLHQVVHRAAMRRPREDPLPAGWQAVLHGAAHPYADLEPWYSARFNDLAVGTLRTYRAAHYRPRGATLIVAGGFDPAIVERWIDYLFADWDGQPPGDRAVDRARLVPAAIAKHDERAKQVAVRIAVPASGTRAARLIATRMLDAAVDEVRTQLGASYGLHASLVEHRLSTYIYIAGSIAADRAPEALGLVRDRIGRLTLSADAVAASFVAARRDVMARLSLVDAGASALASLAESTIVMGRPVQADVITAEDARKLTLAQMEMTLRALDLTRAAILLDGPRDEVTRAFGVLGLTPRVVTR